MKKFSNSNQQLTEDEILSVYSQDGKFDVMLDGVVNTDRFNKAKWKILWIMKEPYGALPKHISCGIQDRVAGIKKDSPLTWKRIALTSYGILNSQNNFIHEPTWSSYGNALNDISIINLKKIAGKSTTNMNELSRFFNGEKNTKYPDIILRQLDQIQPDIVIGARTLNLLKPYISNIRDLKFGHFTSSQTLFLNTYHPAQRKMNLLEYANIIRKRVEQFLNQDPAFC